ncbi:5-methyltetrahydropteroyltriglutamate--homocysteine S-methyltransferase [Streptosporangium sp. NPDC004631]
MRDQRTTVLGYPRIGPDRELKKAVEAYWAGTIDASRLRAVGRDLRERTWTDLRDAGLTDIPSNTFSFYDHVLDTTVMLGAVPARFAGLDGLDRYFAMARGTQGIAPLEMTKWFDTNYHYLAPELGPDTRFRLDWKKPLTEYGEARELGIETRPVLVGPLSYLLLAKSTAETTAGPATGSPAETGEAGGEAGFSPLLLLDDLLDVYAELLERLASAGVTEVQLDEPALAGDRSVEELKALARAYDHLGGLSHRPRLLVATYFGEIGEALPVLAASRVEAIGLDFVAGPGNLAGAAGLAGKTVVAGVVDGRNVWRTRLPTALSTCAALLGLAGEVVVSTSCSLMHVPLDLDREEGLPEGLAFARQKVAEVVAIGRALREGPEAVVPAAAARPPVNARVRARLETLGEGTARAGHTERASLQRAALELPLLPTTTIGSFPQTDAVRRARADLRAGRIDQAGYEAAMRAEIDSVIALQEDIGLDVLVHGEPERNDMVQYFAEQLDGYAATQHGWVQSYGTRCVRPPILFGDVARPEPMTVRWAVYAQSRTDRPVKGMLTGPVTMLAWSFVREDQPLADTARQVALALRDEIRDLEAAGIRIIQVDEPALRELLPLRAADQAGYLAWAVGAFRLATSGVSDSTQIHTHMCYSEFGEIIGAIGDLDADVTSVEAARSRMELLDDLGAAGYARGIGPGVYDIHSPRVPETGEIEQALRLAIRAVEPERLWVNPDCGLKTRGYAETEASLRNMVAAARKVRAS